MSEFRRLVNPVKLCLITGLVLALLAGCSPAVSTATAPSTTAPTTAASSITTTPATTRTQPSTAASESAPTTSSAPAGPGIRVLPEQLKGFSIAGQQCHFLVTFTGELAAAANPIKISAQAENAKITVNNDSMQQGPVAEVVVIPDSSSVGQALTVTFTGTFTGQQGEQTDVKKVVFEVIEGEDDRKDYAEELQARFIAYLEAEHPELGITRQTQWAKTTVSPQWLVVSHYLFFSDEWEMHLEWHIMIAPSDWARIDLRRRYVEQKPSAAFEISSVAGKSTPVTMAVPDEIWR